MNASTTIRDLHAAPAGNRMPRLALRRRSAEHPMAMFSIITGVALLTMAFVPNSGPSLSTLGAPAPVAATRTTAKNTELPIRVTDAACAGQAWGEEDDNCLASIAHESGKSDRVRVRRLASAAPLLDAPNVF